MLVYLKKLQFLILILLVCIFFTSACLNSKKRLIKKINKDDITLSQPDKDAQKIETIERLLQQKLYGPAMSELKMVLNRTSLDNLHPQLIILLSETLMGLGRQEDALYTLQFAKSAFNHNDHKDKNFKEKLAEFLERISDTSPRSLVKHSRADSVSKEISDEQTDEPLVTNSFYETDLRQALFDISMQTGVTIVWDETVEGLITYEAIDKPLSKVLNDILFSNGLTYNIKDNTYFVGSADLDNASFNDLSTTEIFRLANIGATEAKQLLAHPYKQYVNVSEKSNTISVTAPPRLSQTIISDLNVIDSPPPQIEIEAVIVEFSISRLKKLGIEWDLIREPTKHTEALLSTNGVEIDNAALIIDYLRKTLKLAGESFSLFSSIKALANNGIAKIRATPRVVTTHGNSAMLGSTKEQYFFITAADDGQSLFGYYNRLETIKSGIQLEITPYIDDSDFITVYVRPQVDDLIGEGANGLPEISRRSAQTRVRIKNGETITIGGLRLTENKHVKHTIPILGKIPILNYLFSKVDDQKIEKELLIFVTPHVLNP